MNHEIVTMKLETTTNVGVFVDCELEVILHIAVTGFDAEDRTVDYYVDKVTSVSGIEVHESWGDFFSDEQIEEELWRQHDEGEEDGELEAAIDSRDAVCSFEIHLFY